MYKICVWAALLSVLPCILRRLERYIWQTCFYTRLHMLPQITWRLVATSRENTILLHRQALPHYLPLILLHFEQWQVFLYITGNIYGCDVRLSGQHVNVGVINQLNSTLLVCSKKHNRLICFSCFIFKTLLLLEITPSTICFYVFSWTSTWV